MTMPQFTAEASLYRGGNYRAGTGGMPAGVNVHGVSPANGCPKGKWCCNIRGMNICVPCTQTAPFFGNCLSPAIADCWARGGTPSDGC
jgi:hypothetical protein